MLETAEFKHQQEQVRRNKKLIEHYWEGIWNDRTTDVLDDCLAPDVVAHATSMTINGIDEYKKVCKGYINAFGNSHIEIQDLVSEGDMLVSHILLSCDHTGEFDGMPASGKHLTIGAFTLFRIEHGKIVEEWEIFDEMGLMKQLGMELVQKETSV